MDVNMQSIQRIFEGSCQFVVPLYQRRYCWEEQEQWKPLWEDIVDVAERGDGRPHFLGAIVVSQQRTSTGRLQVRHIVDGQQRLVTLQVLLAALRCVALEAEASGSRYHLERLLMNDKRTYKGDDEELKVLPTTGDLDVFQRVIRKAVSWDTVSEPDRHLGRRRQPEDLSGAFRFYESQARDFCADGATDSLDPVKVDRLVDAVGLGLRVAVIDLEAEDDPQAIFECLNARGVPLRAMDLLKNRLLSCIPEQEVEDAYMERWRHFDEEEFWSEELRNGKTEGDTFLYHYLVSFADSMPRQRSLYRDFKIETRGRDASEVMRQVYEASVCYKRLHEDGDGLVGRSLRRWRAGNLRNITPLLLRLLKLADDAPGSEESLHNALHVLESWTMRRRIAGYATSNYNQTIWPMLQRLENVGIRQAATMIIAELEHVQGKVTYWPTDEDIQEAVLEKNMGSNSWFPKKWRRECLTAIEDHLRGPLFDGGPSPAGLTVEHIMPVSWRDHWPATDFPEERDQIVQTLGNLTLTTGNLNSKLSNLPWHDTTEDHDNQTSGKITNKRDVLREHSGLKLNAELIECNHWDEEAIRQRSQRLAGYICEIWPRISAMKAKFAIQESPLPCH